MAASVTLQCTVAAVVIVASIVQIQRLPLVLPNAPLPPVPRLPGPVIQVVGVPEAIRRTFDSSAPVARRALVEPAAIPSHIAKIGDNLDEIGALAPLASGSGSYDGVMNGVLNSVLDGIDATAAPAPRAPTAATPRQQVAPPTRIEVGGKVQEAKLIHRVAPQYPLLARSARISGKVLLSALIGADGRIQSVRVISGHPLLVPASVAAVSQWVYAPTLLNEKPVEVSTIIEVNFTLSN